VLPSFQPQWTARKGAQELYDAYKTVGLTLEDLEGAKFMRIRTVKELQDSGRLDNSLRWANLQEAVAHVLMTPRTAGSVDIRIWFRFFPWE